jgi:hypothetical protein
MLAVTSNRRDLRRNTTGIGWSVAVTGSVVLGSPILVALMMVEWSLLGCYAVWLL